MIAELKKISKSKIALLGLGLENLALLKFLIKNKAASDITICDARPLEKLLPLLEGMKASEKKKLQWRLEEKFNKDLEDFNILFRAPGWPIFCPGIQIALKKSRTELNSPMNLFLKLCPSKKIVGVTGTKGKGTTSSLLVAIFKESKKKVWLGGNIGIAPFGFIDKVKKDDFVVLELSSFQLEDLRLSPRYAILLNMYHEHLAPADPLNPNYHKNYPSYLRAKLTIAKWQDKQGVFIVNEGLKKLLEKNKKNLGHGKLIYFKPSNLPSGLEGDYYKENVGAAVTLAKILHLPQESIAKAVKKFKNLEHRLEFVRELKGIRYYDNSFSTTPESSSLDLKSFPTPIVLLAGGADKGSNFKPFAQMIKEKVQLLILFPGQGTDRLRSEVIKAGFSDKNIKITTSMDEAVKSAAAAVKTKGTVLLSTGCASFGFFKNYKERGNLFKEAVKRLK